MRNPQPGRGSRPKRPRPASKLPEFGNAPSDVLAKGMIDLILCATMAARSYLLREIVALSDPDMAALLRALRGCGKISDETGNLLPSLCSQLHLELVIRHDEPRQFARVMAALELSDFDLSTHGRYIRADVLQFVAEVVREGSTDTLAGMRDRLAQCIDVAAFSRLVKQCGSCRELVKIAKEDDPSRSPYEVRICTEACNETIVIFEIAGLWWLDAGRGSIRQTHYLDTGDQ
jgi:hypothetical protein